MNSYKNIFKIKISKNELRTITSISDNFMLRSSIPNLPASAGSGSVESKVDS